MRLQEQEREWDKRSGDENEITGAEVKLGSWERK